MLFIQQSSSFRAWTSRALMMYFRRTLLFLIVSPHQSTINNYDLLQQQQTIDWKDVENRLTVNEEKTVQESLNNRSEKISNRIQTSQSKYNLLKEYVLKSLSQRLNNSTVKSLQKEEQNSAYIESINQSSSTSTEQSLKLFLSASSVAEQVESPQSNFFQGSNSMSLKLPSKTKMDENEIVNNTTDRYQINPSFSLCQLMSINNRNQSHIAQSYNSHLNCTELIPSCPVSFYLGKKKIQYLNL